MRPFILPGTMLLLAGVTLLSATTDQDAALIDLMPKGVVIGVAVNQRQFEGTDPAAVEIITRQFNQISRENVLKFQPTQPAADRYTFDAADHYVQFGLGSPASAQAGVQCGRRDAEKREVRIAAGLVAAAIVAVTQAPASPRLAGEAQPPASPLSLWYRAPASDHPILPLDGQRQSRQAGTAEWVQALPVGNGRLGAMVFGGVVHERLQLNEDTLWAGRPYDPVNPEAKDTLPEIRRLLAEGNYPEAAKLVGEKVMSKPLAQLHRRPPSVRDQRVVNVSA